MTKTKLSDLLREAAAEMWSHHDGDATGNRLLAEAERLDAGPLDDPTDNDSAKAQLAYVEGWLAACGGEVEHG